MNANFWITVGIVCGAISLFSIPYGFYLKGRAGDSDGKGIVSIIQSKIFNPAKAKIHLAAPQIISPGQKTKIAFNKEIFDTRHEFNTALYRWTASKRAFYKIQVNVKTKEVPGEAMVKIEITKNGLSIIEDKTQGESGKISLMDTIESFANDYIEVYIQHDYTNDILLDSDPGQTYLLIEEG
jgi:hypothetical protein